METSIHSAIQTLLEHQIHSLPVLSTDIEKMICNQGFKIIPLDVPLSKSNIESLTQLGILETAKKYKAFTYVDYAQNHRFVFYKTNLSLEEKTIFLSHELAHIRLNHFSLPGTRCSSDFKNTSPQEKEADEFAIELLAPTCILKSVRQITPEKISHLTLLERSKAENVFFKVKSHSNNTRDEQKLCNLFKIYEKDTKYNMLTQRQKYIALFTGIIAVCTIGIFIGRYSSNSQKYPIPSPSSQIVATQTPAPTPVTDSDVLARQVAVAASGDKFHRSDCRYVKNRTNIDIMSVEEALSKNLAPCSVCRPTE